MSNALRYLNPVGRLHVGVSHILSECGYVSLCAHASISDPGWEAGNARRFVVCRWCASIMARKDRAEENKRIAHKHDRELIAAWNEKAKEF